MPYRRLPNTDAARIRSMEAALSQAEKDEMDFKTVIPFDLQYKLKNLYPEFTQAVDLYNQAYKRQVEAGKKLKKDFKMARLYLSHFLQVFNMAIIRNEINPREREFFELPPQDLSLPRLQTEKDLLHWGEIVISGEEKRLSRGHTPITNPKITLVKLYYQRFKENYLFYKKLQEITAANLENVSRLRPKVNKLIQKIWNSVEEYFADLPPRQKRENAARYGVVYFYRKEERESQEN